MVNAPPVVFINGLIVDIHNGKQAVLGAVNNFLFVGFIPERAQRFLLGKYGFRAFKAGIAAILPDEKNISAGIQDKRKLGPFVDAQRHVVSPVQSDNAGLGNFGILKKRENLPKNKDKN